MQHSICTNINSDHCWGSGWYPTVKKTSAHYCYWNRGNANSDHCWNIAPQIRTVIPVYVRFDCVKYSGEHAAGDDSDDNSGNRPAYSLGVAMLVFRISSYAFARPPLLDIVQSRDFCFVRQMKPADRKGAGSFPKHKCERRTAYDIQPTNHKLGRLWTWDSQARRPVSKVPRYRVTKNR